MPKDIGDQFDRGSALEQTGGQRAPQDVAALLGAVQAGAMEGTADGLGYGRAPKRVSHRLHVAHEELACLRGGAPVM